MINTTYPGVYVREESSGARAVSGVATSITAFVGMTQRGPLNQPLRIFNFADYGRSFGLGPEGGEMARQVQLYFDNGGGEAWITRIADGAEAANITLNTEAGAATLVLTAKEAGINGNMLRAEVSYATTSPEERFTLTVYRRVVNTAGVAEKLDSETFANLSMNPDDANYAVNLITATSALVTAAQPGPPAAPTPVPPAATSETYSGLLLPAAAGDALDTVMARIAPATVAALRVSLNGRPALPLTVDLTGVTALNIATGVTGRLAQAIHDTLLGDGFDITISANFASVTVGGATFRQLQLTANAASVVITPGTGVDLATALMLTQDTGAVYVDRYAGARPAPSGYVSRLATAAGGLDITRLIALGAVVKNTLTTWSLTQSTLPATIGPVAIALPDGADRMYQGTAFAPTLPDDESVGALANISANLATLIASINTQAEDTWTAQMQGYRIALQSKLPGSDSDLGAAFSTGGGTNLAAAGGVFDPAVGPQNVVAYTLGRNGAPLGTTLGGDYQDRGTAVNGSNGNIPLEQTYRDAFTQIERNVNLFNLMVLPRARTAAAVQTDVQRKSAYNAASAFCARKRAFLLVDPPALDQASVWRDATSAEAGADALRIGLETRNSAVFWPRLKQADGSFQDPSGPMAGLMARIDGTRGVWKASAGVEATIRGVAGVEYPMSDPDNGVINPKAVNAVRVFPDGVLSWGARTLVGFNDSGNIDDKYIPVRRTMLFIEESLYRGLRFAVFEPNDEPLWAQIRLAAGSFMNGLFRQGAFAGRKSSDAYYVLCDRSTTTPTDQNLGIVNVVVAFAPLKPTEFVILTVKQIAAQAQT